MATAPGRCDRCGDEVIPLGRHVCGHPVSTELLEVLRLLVGERLDTERRRAARAAEIRARHLRHVGGRPIQ